MAILRRSAVAALLVLVWSGPARADVVLDWNGLAAQLIVGPGGANKVPPLGLVDLAIVHTAIYDAVNAVEGFGEQPKVVNGFSDLMVEVFGENGRHARSAVGMGSLPMGIPVEIEMILELNAAAPAPSRKPKPARAARAAKKPKRRR